MENVGIWSGKMWGIKGIKVNHDLQTSRCLQKITDIKLSLLWRNSMGFWSCLAQYCSCKKNIDPTYQAKHFILVTIMLSSDHEMPTKEHSTTIQPVTQFALCKVCTTQRLRLGWMNVLSNIRLKMINVNKNKQDI